MEKDQSDLIARLRLEIQRLQNDLENERKKNKDLVEKVRELLTNGAR